MRRNKKGEPLARAAERRYHGLMQERENFLAVWRQITDYIVPNRGLYDDEAPNQGRRRDSYLLDSASVRALGLLQSGIQGGLTSPSLQWFRLAVSDPELNKDVAVRQWCDECQEIMLDEFARSNIYDCLFGIYGEIGAFGTGAMLLEDDVRASRIHGRLFTAGQYAAGFDCNGMPDVFAHAVQMTAAQMASRFGEDRLSDAAKNALRTDRQDTWFLVYHLIEADTGGVTRFPHVSYYWQPGQEQALDVGGFEEFPVLVPRWETVGADAYGYGPGWQALGDSKMLQEMYRDFLIAQKMAIRPPIMMSTEARNVRASLHPGSVTYADSDIGAKPIYQIRPDIQGQMMAISNIEQKVREAFFADLFLLNTDRSVRQMTAYEVEQRQREKLQMLGPVLERMDHELLDPLIGRTFNILMRRRALPPPPEALEGSKVEIEYISPLAIAQKSSSVGTMTSMLQMIAQLANFDPTVMDNVDPDKIVGEYMRMTGVPAAIIRSADEVRALRQQRAEQQAQMEQQMQMASAAETAAPMLDGLAGVGEMPELAELLQGGGGAAGGAAM